MLILILLRNSVFVNEALTGKVRGAPLLLDLSRLSNNGSINTNVWITVVWEYVRHNLLLDRGSWYLQVQNVRTRSILGEILEHLRIVNDSQIHYWRWWILNWGSRGYSIADSTAVWRGKVLWMRILTGLLLGLRRQTIADIVQRIANANLTHFIVDSTSKGTILLCSRVLFCCLAIVCCVPTTG